MLLQAKNRALKKVKHKRTGQLPCHRCIVIRFFLMAVACIALLQFLAPQTFIILHGLNTLTLAILFVGGFGIIAILKSLINYLSAQPYNIKNKS